MRTTTIDPCLPLALEDMPASLLRVLVGAGRALGHALLDVHGRILWADSGFEGVCGPLGTLVGEALSPVFGQAEEDDAGQWLAAAASSKGEVRVLRCWRGPGARRWFHVALRSLDVTVGTRARALVTLDEAQAPGQRLAPGMPDWRQPGAMTPSQELVRLTLLLEVAQKFARVGVWDHDPRNGVGHWDRHVWRLFGIDTEVDSPAPELALTRVHPEDVSALNELYAPLRPGGYSRRFRVLHRDGGTHRLHAQFIVEGDAQGAPAHVYGVMRDETEATEATRQLQDAHEQLQLALDLANLAIWRHDLRSDQLVPSEQVWRMLGLVVPPGDMSYSEFLARFAHPDDLPRMVESARLARRSGQPHETTARLRRADGSWCHTLVRRVLQRDETGQPLAFLGVTMEITAQIEESQRVLQSEHRLALATDAAAVGLWEMDLDSRAVTWNRQMHLLHGLQSGEPLPGLGEWLDAHVHPGDRERVRDELDSLLLQPRGTAESQCRLLRPDGSVRWVIHRTHVEPRGETRVLLGVMTDVTAVVQAQAQLHEATERAALATRSAGIGTWEHDLETGEALWDEQMFALRGLAPRERALTHDERLALVHPDDIAPMEQQLRAAASSGSACEYEFRVRLPDGRWRRLASRSVVLRDSAGRLCRQIGVNWNVTRPGDDEQPASSPAPQHRPAPHVQGGSRAREQLRSG